jgi:hypothetical protein
MCRFLAFISTCLNDVSTPSTRVRKSRNDAEESTGSLRYERLGRRYRGAVARRTVVSGCFLGMRNGPRC